MGAVFGPITLIWFLVLAGLGVHAIALEPSVLRAVSPAHAIAFFGHDGLHGVLVPAAVFLVVTGTEAFYADMGHFGRRPIQLAWFALAAPALLLDYFGQGALLLVDAETAHNPFYRLAPPSALYPLVALATIATIIASQAVISGAFSLTRQAAQRGYSPRIEVTHTCSDEEGQIYVGPIDWAPMVACCALVIGFGDSTQLAAAYGMAVTTTMVLTTVLFFVFLRERRGWSRLAACALCSAFLVVDLAFLSANLVKIEHGGWLPLVVALAVCSVLITWKRGRIVLRRRLHETALPLDMFLRDLTSGLIQRVPGTACS